MLWGELEIRRSELKKPKVLQGETTGCFRDGVGSSEEQNPGKNTDSKVCFFVISSKNYGVSQRFKKRPFVLHSGKQFTDVHA